MKNLPIFCLGCFEKLTSESFTLSKVSPSSEFQITVCKICARNPKFRAEEPGSFSQASAWNRRENVEDVIKRYQNENSFKKQERGAWVSSTETFSCSRIRLNRDGGAEDSKEIFVGFWHSANEFFQLENDRQAELIAHEENSVTEYVEEYYKKLLERVENAKLNAIEKVKVFFRSISSKSNAVFEYKKSLLATLVNQESEVLKPNFARPRTPKASDETSAPLRILQSLSRFFSPEDILRTVSSNIKLVLTEAESDRPSRSDLDDLRIGFDVGTFHRLERREANSVLVSTSNFELSDLELKNLFETFGTVVSIEMSFDRNDRFAGKAILTFEDPLAAEKSILLNGIQIEEKEVKVEIRPTQTGGSVKKGVGSYKDDHQSLRESSFSEYIYADD